jgi:hypothetical protein
LEDWVFWHPGSKYELIADAFDKGESKSKAKKFEPSASVISQVDLLDRQGAKAGRDKAIAAMKP